MEMMTMTAAARQRSHLHDLEIDDYGVEALELSMEYTARLRAVTGNLGRVLGRRDSAQLVAQYVAYARDLEHVSDSAPVGLAHWIRTLEAQ
jgi:hypothetical protein